MNNNLKNKFKRVTRQLFSYLQSYGFHESAGPVDESDLYTKIFFCGENVAIVFSYDLREHVCDCYVGKIINEKLCTDKSLNGFWSPLFTYLRKKYNFRGGVVIDKDIEYIEFKELYEYDVMIRTLGSKLLADDVDAF